MRRSLALAVLSSFLLAPLASRAEDLTKRVRKAIEEATLDQSGTHPFHLKATLAPSFDRDKNSGRTGEVEIWWAAPNRWKREVRSPSFHQVEIVDGLSDWQKNEGDVFPEWLRQLSVALIRPVSNIDLALDRLRSAEVRDVIGELDIRWTILGSDGSVSKTIGSGMRLMKDGSLESAADLGWASWREQISNFHGRKVARKLTGEGLGGPEVTAKVITLEDLDETSGLFRPEGKSDPPLRTVAMQELDARKNLLPWQMEPWPSVANGPLEGILIAEVLIGRGGKVADIGTTLSDNPGLIEPAEERMRRMQFRPFTVDGQPAFVVTTLTMPFKTTRPAGVEAFDSARNYFEHGRKIGFPAAGGAAYVLTAQFQAEGLQATSRPVLTPTHL